MTGSDPHKPLIWRHQVVILTRLDCLAAVFWVQNARSKGRGNASREPPFPPGPVWHITNRSPSEGASAQVRARPSSLPALALRSQEAPRAMWARRRSSVHPHPSAMPSSRRMSWRLCADWLRTLIPVKPILMHMPLSTDHQSAPSQVAGDYRSQGCRGEWRDPARSARQRRSELVEFDSKKRSAHVGSRTRGSRRYTGDAPVKQRLRARDSLTLAWRRMWHTQNAQAGDVAGTGG